MGKQLEQKIFMSSRTNGESLVRIKSTQPMVNIIKSMYKMTIRNITKKAKKCVQKVHSVDLYFKKQVLTKCTQ